MWIIRFLRSSIGKKWVMAFTGLCLILFLFSHGAGNATIFFGGSLFQNYADQLHSHPLIVAIFSGLVLLILLTHVGTGLFLFFENRQARPRGYLVASRAVKNPWASSTMAYSGLIILIFILIHVFTFRFLDESTLISTAVEDLLSGFFTGLFYIVSFIVLAVHISHGFWSMLQTFGVNHPRYTVFISRLTLALPIFFLTLFTAIPLYFFLGGSLQ
ncbi:MAG: succinate dehydrogenase cytochrome b subunit [Thermodesulfobacteriota bacterium]